MDIICGDCRDELPKLQPGSIDLIVTDPPYGETSLDWDCWPCGWLDLLPRLLAPHASVWMFGSQRMFIEHAPEFAAAGFRVVQDLVWEKHNGSSLSNDRFRRVHEHAVQFCPVGRRWDEIYKRPLFTHDAVARTVRRKARPAHWGEIGEGDFRSDDGGPRLMRSVMCARSEHGRALHPTQKPLSVLLPLIEYSSSPGALVLDPFGGAGSTALACKRSGRDCILVEGRPYYVDVAMRRLDGDEPLFRAV